MSCCATVEVFSFQTSVSLDRLCFELSFVLSPPSLWSAFERDYQVRALNSSCYAESLSDISTCFIVSFEGGVSSSAFSLKSRGLSMPYAQKGQSCLSLLCENPWMFSHAMDTLAEWSRRRPAKLMGSPRVPQVSNFLFRGPQACPWGDRKIDSGDWKQCEAFNKAVFSWQSDRDGVSNFDVIISGNPETGQVRRF